MKRIWSLITVVVMAIFILPITAYATEESTEEVTPIVCGDYEYALNENNEAIITAYNGTAAELEIPEKLDGYPVVKIGDGAFYRCESLLSVTIPDSVTDMGYSVFSYCRNLKRAKLSKKCKIIPYCAFANTAISTIDIPDIVNTIDSGAFEESGLVEIVIPNTVKEVGNYAFRGCQNLKRIQLGCGIEILSQEVFSKCTALEDINISCCVKSIEYLAFDGCTNLTKITIPQTTKSINYIIDNPTQLAVYGVPGSYAQTWATENGATFVEYEKHATSVSINPSKITLNKGESTDVPTVLVTPADCTDKVELKANNQSIASIQEKILYGWSRGTTAVTATAGELSASCEVTVISNGKDVVISYPNVDTIYLHAYIYDADGNRIYISQVNNTYYKTLTLEDVDPGTYTLEIYIGDFVSRKYTTIIGNMDVNLEVQLHKTGDITGDDTINARDKKMLYNHIAGTAILEDYDFAVGDVTGDGTLNARDKKMIYNHIAGTSSLWE